VVAWKWTSDLDGDFGDSEDLDYVGLSVGTHTISFSAKDNDGVWSDAAERSLTLNEAPNTPPSITLTAPSDEATTTTTKPTLQWTADDVDDSDTLSFDVYLDTSPNPVTLVADDITNKTFTTEKLTRGTTYYWKVVVSDGKDEMPSEIWSFEVEKEDDDSGEIMGFSPVVVIGFVILIVIIGIFGVSHIMTRNLIQLKNKGDDKNGNS